MLNKNDFIDFSALVVSGIFGAVISPIGHRGHQNGPFLSVKSGLSGLYDYISEILAYRPQGCNNRNYFGGESCENCEKCANLIV